MGSCCAKPSLTQDDELKADPTSARGSSAPVLAARAASAPSGDSVAAGSNNRGRTGSGGADDGGGDVADPAMVALGQLAPGSSSRAPPLQNPGAGEGAPLDADAPPAAADPAPDPSIGSAAVEANDADARAAAAAPAPAARVPPSAGTGPATKAPLEMVAGAMSLKGFKADLPQWPNQDTHLVTWPCRDLMLAAVFDGHGIHGHHISERVRAVFESNAPAMIAQLDDGLQEAFGNFFAFLQKTLEAEGMCRYSGTTATIALIDGNKSEAIVAHVGDSTMIIADGDSVVFHTNDHKVDDEVEKRVVDHGGEVRLETISSVTTRRVYQPGAGYPGLAMARALGDSCAHSLGVTCIPEVSRVPLQGGQILVLASDGVWDTVPPADTLSYFKKLHADAAAGGEAPGVAELAQALVTEAHARYPADAANKDDATAVVVRLRGGVPQRVSSSASCQAAPLGKGGAGAGDGGPGGATRPNASPNGTTAVAEKASGA